MRDINIFTKTNLLIPAKLDNAIGSIRDKNFKKMSDLNIELQEMNVKHAHKDEEGNPKMKDVKEGDEVRQHYDIIDMPAYEAERDEILNKKITFTIEKVNPSDLGQTIFDKRQSNFEAFRKYIVRDGVFQMG